MKRCVAILVLAVCMLCTLLAVAGCEHYEPESTEAQAASYYQEKYGERVKVADAHGLGNYALFGYSYIGMEYVMEDGASVIYLDHEGLFRDNRQTQEIGEATRAFAEEKLAALPGIVVAPKDGFRQCRIRGAAAERGEGVEYYIHNESDIGITRVLGFDRFSVICDPHQHSGHRTLADGGIYFLGVPQDIAPQFTYNDDRDVSLQIMQSVSL